MRSVRFRLFIRCHSFEDIDNRRQPDKVRLDCNGDLRDPTAIALFYPCKTRHFNRFQNCKDFDAVMIIPQHLEDNGEGLDDGSRGGCVW